MELKKILQDWPGKSPSDENSISHPAVYHMIDVGAVLDQLLAREGFERPLHQALCFLGILHDLGKIGEQFRAMLLEGQTQADRHWQVSMAWFDHFDKAYFEKRLGSDEYLRYLLYAAVAGHHGGPPQSSAREWGRMVKNAGEEAGDAVGIVIEAIGSLFPEACLNELREDLEEAGGDWRISASSLSWWYSGVISVADWIGSNTEWFPAVAPGPGIAEYWDQARKRSDVALQACGLLAARPASMPADKLFSFDTHTPMQQQAVEIVLPGSQVLAIVEDATGSGKTEAGLMLALRMMQSGRADGVFFALPTMATANAMFDRMLAMGKMFEGAPSLALSHSRSGMDDRFRQIIGRRRREPDQQISCADWFADGKRKALLAQLGVGTIDQALLGVLPTRYCSLRLYALSRRILVVDEAHDYDPYMQRELEALLEFQAMLGGSAILMTATLPVGMRKKLVAAFMRGADLPPVSAESAAFPQLSIFGETIQEVAVAESGKRSVAVRRLGSLDEAIDLLVGQVAAGAACAFVRNSVDEAIAAMQALQARGVEVRLHHARFALCDRLENETRILGVYGKTGVGRAGTVVVGTQVLEQSLDIDFDVMVSDLAPIGALIQRAGRLWRHMRIRPASDRPVSEPVLHVLSPDPAQVEDADWSKEILGTGWFVYPVPVQWRTAKVLFDAGVIETPGNLRHLIEAVEDESATVLPSALDKAEYERLGNSTSERQLANLNILKPYEDFRGADQVFNDTTYPTRLGSEQVILVLARENDGRLCPWATDEDEDRAWVLSEVSISRRRWEASGGVDQETPLIKAVCDGWPAWKEGRYFVCPVAEGARVAEHLQYDVSIGFDFDSGRNEGDTCI